METTEQQENTQEQQPLITFSVTKAGIAKLAEKYKDVPKDLSVKENYALVKEAASTIRKLRGEVEKRRKELKEDALEWGRKVDGTAKEIKEALLEIETPHVEAKKAYDTEQEIKKREAAKAEEKRIDGIAERIAGIKSLPTTHISSGSADIKKALDQLNKDMDTHGEWAMEFAEKAEKAIIEALVKLDELHGMKVQQENAEAERKKQEEKRRQEEEARKKAEEEARAAREKELEAERQKLAEEKAAIEAEKAKMAAELEELKKQKQEEAMKDEAKDQNLPAQNTPQEESQQATEHTQQESGAALLQPPTGTTDEKPVPEKPTTTSGLTQDYKDSGNAILKITGYKGLAKQLLDAIINGDIPNITYTGEK